jgi:hypothetical protein
MPWLTKCQVEHYRGWTYVTLLDEADNDYSYVAKPGILTHEQLQSPKSGDPLLGVSYPTRAEAISAAKAEIDAEVSKELVVRG